MTVFKIQVDLAAIRDAIESGPPEVLLEVTVGWAHEPVALLSDTKPRGPLASLMNAGLLRVDQRLELHQPRARREAVAVVQADGSLRIEGRMASHSSPSKAARSITKTPTNGWTAFRTADGRTLDDLRTELEELEDA